MRCGVVAKVGQDRCGHSKPLSRDDEQRKANVRRNWQAARSVFALAQTRGLRGEWPRASAPEPEMAVARAPAPAPPFQSWPLCQSNCAPRRHVNSAVGARSPDSIPRIQEAGLTPAADPIAAPREIGLPPKDRREPPNYRGRSSLRSITLQIAQQLVDGHYRLTRRRLASDQNRRRDPALAAGVQP